ncbi:MAG: ribose-phosphate diphosphokinase [Gemmatimonadota bacterium]
MSVRIVAGTAHPSLAAAVASALGCALTACEVERFPDGELRPVVVSVRGEDVYVVQPTGPPVNEHLVELLLVLDACRRAGADRVTAVVPYFGYARQDRRARTGEAVGARVVADALVSAGAQRLVVVDPHTAALEAMCGVPVEMLGAAPVLARALEPTIAEDAVVVAPDLGAVKLAERFAALLGRSVAVVRKTRVSGTSVRAAELVGDVRGCAAVIVDDMISTGGTIEAAARVLHSLGARNGIVVAATHGLLVGPACDRLVTAGLQRLLITDSLPAVASPSLPLETHSIAALLADAIGRLHRNEDLADLLVHT